MQKPSEKNKHMNLEKRIEIQSGLGEGKSFKAIAEQIGKGKTTVSREVKLHRQPYRNGYVRTDEICPNLLSPPYVCNGCPLKGKSKCRYLRYIYSAKDAQKEYETTLRESRSGIALNKEEFYATEKIITDAVRRGQHIYHAIVANNLKISQSSVYRYIKAGYYTIRPLDLPRAVKFKPRGTHIHEQIPQWVRNGRSYDDFLAYTEEHSDVPVIQLDTVIGRIGGKTLMTLHFTNCAFMIGLLLDNKTSAEAADKIIRLKQRLRKHGYSFGDIFPLLLTDNGGEFRRVEAFENDTDGIPETKLFFCEPHSPEEKAHIEKNHTLLRDILPSGTSFDNLDQEMVNRIFSHLNGVKRKQFNGKSAYEMFTFFYSGDLAKAMGISEIDPNEVCQSPCLLAERFSL